MKQGGFFQIPPFDGHACLWLTLPTAGWIRVFHPLERALTGRTNKGPVAKNAFCNRPCLKVWFRSVSS